MTVIRPIADADIDAVADIHVRTWQAGYAGIIPAGYLASLNRHTNARHRRSRATRPDQHTLVIEEEGRIAGFASFGPYLIAGDSYDLGIGHLYAIYVAPADWGRGFGAELLLAAKAGLAAAGYPEMRLWVLTDNVRARRFYERMGLKPDGAIGLFTPQGSTAELTELRYTTAL